jgi:hypothetical protein
MRNTMMSPIALIGAGNIFDFDNFLTGSNDNVAVNDNVGLSFDGNVTGPTSNIFEFPTHTGAV